MLPLRISPSSAPTNSTTSVTSGDCLRIAVAAADTREVSCSVPPGGSSISSAELAKSSGGTKAVGMMPRLATDSMKKTTPPAMVFQRLATHQRSAAR